MTPALAASCDANPKRTGGSSVGFYSSKTRIPGFLGNIKNNFSSQGRLRVYKDLIIFPF